MKPPLQSLAPLARLSEEQIELLARRLKAARTLVSKPHRSRYDVELAAEDGVHASTLYRDIRRLEGRGTIEDLAPRNQGWPEGRSKLHGRQEELINEYLRGRRLFPPEPGCCHPQVPADPRDGASLLQVCVYPRAWRPLETN